MKHISQYSDRTSGEGHDPGPEDRNATSSSSDGYTAREVALAIRRLDLKMAQMHLELSERMGLSAAEVLALAHLSLEGALGPTELVHRLHMTTGAMTALLDRLAERGFIMRRPHPTDRRRVVVRLTGSGRDLLFTNVHGMAGDVVALTDRLSDEERHIVGRYLDEVSQVIAGPGWWPEARGGDGVVNRGAP